MDLDEDSTNKKVIPLNQSQTKVFSERESRHVRAKGETPGRSPVVVSRKDPRMLPRRTERAREGTCRSARDALASRTDRVLSLIQARSRRCTASASINCSAVLYRLMNSMRHDVETGRRDDGARECPVKALLFRAKVLEITGWQEGNGASLTLHQKINRLFEQIERGFINIRTHIRGIEAVHRPHTLPFAYAADPDLFKVNCELYAPGKIEELTAFQRALYACLYHV